MQTDEKLMPLFQKDTDGSTMKTKVRWERARRRSRTDKQLVQARRNYTIVEYMPSGELIFDIRVEKAPGAGETVGHVLTRLAFLRHADSQIPHLRPRTAVERARRDGHQACDCPRGERRE